MSDQRKIYQRNRGCFKLFVFLLLLLTATFGAGDQAKAASVSEQEMAIDYSDLQEVIKDVLGKGMNSIFRNTSGN
jgi:hypothetical protein